MSLMNDLFGFKFLRSKEKEKKVSFSEPSIDGIDIESQSSAAYYAYTYDYEGLFKSDTELINRYRELSLYSEVDTAVQEIVHEAISEDEVGNIVMLDLSETPVSNAFKERLQEEFQSVLRLFNLKENGSEMFRRFYLEGRLYFHPIVDPAFANKGILEIRPLDATRIKKINEISREKNPKTGVEFISDIDSYYVYSMEDSREGIKIAEDTIISATSGIVDAQTGLTLSHIHKAIRPANQLRMLEDANVIYFMARSPMRRIFYIDTGSLPNHKAEEYVRGIRDQYRNKLIYDSKTGEMKDTKNILSMMEDYWMPRREGNKTTEIQTLEGSSNLNQQLESMEFFKKKMYVALNIPQSRLEAGSQYNIGRATEITRDEIKFAKFIDSLRRRFSTVFIQALRINCLFKGIMKLEDWEELESTLQIVFATDNHFAALKELELINTRTASLNDIDQFVGKYYSRRWVMSHILGLTDDEIAEMDDEIKMEKEKGDIEPVADEGMGGGFGDAGGGDFGGDDFGDEPVADFTPSGDEDTFDDLEPDEPAEEPISTTEPQPGAPSWM